MCSTQRTRFLKRRHEFDDSTLMIDRFTQQTLDPSNISPNQLEVIHNTFFVTVRYKMNVGLKNATRRKKEAKTKYDC